MVQESEWLSWSPTRFILSLVLVISLSLLLLRSLFSRRVRSPYELDGISFLNARSFFTKRYDFLNYHIKTRGLKMFEFFILQHRVVAVSGEEARKIFFTEHSLFLGEGYKMLSGASPALKDINVDTGGKDDDAEFVKRALIMMRKDRITELLPIMLDDIDQRMKMWGSEGTLNPFKEVYDLVFQMTVRMATCRELAEDRRATDKLMKYFWNFEKSHTPMSLLFPWFPGPAKIKQLWAITRMYMMILNSVKLRRKAEVPTMETIDLLIEYGDPDQAIVGTILGTIFAGLVNTGMNSCWALLFLGSHPEWKEKVKIEANALIAANTNTLSDQPLHKRLATIPVHSWEDELPIMDSIIRETLRLCVTGAALRRNVLKDVAFSDLVVRKGDFVTYLTADVQLNPDLYPEPFKFDPSRYDEGRADDKKETFGYLSWGAGRHPCAGMKIAKLEMKMILVLLLVGYDYELVDRNGLYPKSLPEPDRNDTHQAHPIGDTCYLKFKRVIE